MTTPKRSKAETEQTNQKDLVAVVVTHNRLAQLKITLASLLASEIGHLRAVVVVDTASSDGTSEWLLAQNEPRLRVLRCDENIGGAGGFERGMRYVSKEFDPDWLVLMDDDGRPAPDGLAQFHAMDFRDWDAVAAAVYFPNGDICEMNRPSRNPFWNLPTLLKTLLRGRSGFHLSPDLYRSEAPYPIDVTSFVGFFVSRRGLDLAGYPDPDLFIYGDDGLYTLGLSQLGGRICFAPTVRFEHDCSTFSGVQRGRFKPLWKAYYYHRNLLMLYRLAAGWLFWPALVVILPKWLSKTRTHTGSRRRFLRLMAHAIRDGVMQRTNRKHSTVKGWSGEEDGV